MSDIEYEQLMETFGDMSLNELAIEFRKAKDELDRCAKIKTQAQKLHDFLAENIIPERMDDEGFDTVKIAGIGRLQVKSDIRCACPAAHRDELADWLRDHNHGALVSTTVNSSTLKAFVKEQMKEGKAYPENLLNITPYSKASIVKA